jgi:lambda repressor-like predicted transcriptional regulator
MGDANLPRLNIAANPIANKYREGKLKRTLKRELKEPETIHAEAFGMPRQFLWPMGENPQKGATA